jgi:hypothetical protein
VAICTVAGRVSLVGKLVADEIPARAD